MPFTSEFSQGTRYGAPTHPPPSGQTIARIAESSRVRADRTRKTLIGGRNINELRLPPRLWPRPGPAPGRETSLARPRGLNLRPESEVYFAPPFRPQETAHECPVADLSGFRIQPADQRP